MQQKKVTKKTCSVFFTFSLCNARCRLRRLRDYLAALRLRQSFCSGLYEAFKGGFAARLIAPVLRGCDTKSFVSLTSLSLVHRPAAFAGYPPLPRAVERFLNFLSLLIFFHSSFFMISTSYNVFYIMLHFSVHVKSYFPSFIFKS